MSRVARDGATQFSILEEPSEQRRKAIDKTVEYGMAIPVPEPRPWFVHDDGRQRIPMDVFMLRELDGKLRIVVDCHIPDVPLDNLDGVTHEIQYHMEMLNMALSVALGGVL